MAPAKSSKLRDSFKLPHFGKSKKTCEQTQKETAIDTGKSATTEPESVLTQRNREQSPLLHLPAEIRNPIHEYPLGRDHVHFTDGYDYPAKCSLRYMEDGPSSFIYLVNLEFACPQLGQETKPLPYGPKNFCFSTPEQFLKWSGNLSLEAKSEIRWAQFETPFLVEKKHGFFIELSTFPNLEKVAFQPLRGFEEYMRGGKWKFISWAQWCFD